jgi:hypothetical protein
MSPVKDQNPSIVTHTPTFTGAGNHMTGNREAFFKLDTSISSTVMFGDNSAVHIQGRGTILFACKTGEHRALTDIYYIPKLRSNNVCLV